MSRFNQNTANQVSAARVRGRPDGIGRPTSSEAELISDDLRRSTDLFLNKRRRIVALSLVSSACMGAVTAYQTGLLRHLVELPLDIFDADRVDASGEAYEFLKTPDAALALVSYSVTIVLASAGTAERWRVRPWLPIALAGKAVIDALGGLLLTGEQLSKHRRFCLWCLVASAANVAMVPYAVPEARSAIASIFSSS